MFYYKFVGYIFLSAVIAAATACGSSSAKPDDGLAGAANPSSSSSQPSGEGRADATRESNLSSGSLSSEPKGEKSPATSSSSLEQLKDGKPTKTAASSPLKDVLFEFDRHDLTAEARDTLRSNAEWLKRNASTRIEVEGHCDERGTSEYNLALAAKRAQATRDYLITLGITPDRISTISYGEEIPACIESSESCWRQNRRVRFVVAPPRAAS
jgi:peptidoglycan-associated lipoprotein